VRFAATFILGRSTVMTKSTAFNSKILTTIRVDDSIHSIFQAGKQVGCIWLRENDRDYSVCLYAANRSTDEFHVTASSPSEALAKVLKGNAVKFTARAQAIISMAKAMARA
jgi:hypothetical protein